MNGEYLEDVAHELDIDSLYIEEILTVVCEDDSDENINSGNLSFYITAIGSDETMAKDVMSFVLGELNRLHPEMELRFGNIQSYQYRQMPVQKWIYH